MEIGKKMFWGWGLGVLLCCGACTGLNTPPSTPEAAEKNAPAATQSPSKEAALAPAKESAPAAGEATPAAQPSAGPGLELYENEAFTMEIPQGWEVAAAGRGLYHVVRVYDPREPLKQIFTLLQAEGLLHNQMAKTAWHEAAQDDPQMSLLAEAPVLDPPSVGNFYQIFPQYVHYISAHEPSYTGFFFPRFEGLKIVANQPLQLNRPEKVLDSRLLQATFSQEGRIGEGLFSAAIVDFGEVPMVMEIDKRPRKVDGGYYLAYDIAAITAPQGQLGEWIETMISSLHSLRYSDKFLQSLAPDSEKEEASAPAVIDHADVISQAMLKFWKSKPQAASPKGEATQEKAPKTEAQ